VINFSISGGSSPFTDPVELAFLDAYAAGILVSASAGNSGPGAETADHAGAWTNTVGASTSNRHWLTTLHLEADGGASFEAGGASVAPSLEDPAPVVLADDIEGYDDPLCLEPFPASDSAEGLVVVCDGRVSRLQKSFNVQNSGGFGTILLNNQDIDLFTDNHYTPAIMLPQTERQAVLDFLAANTGVTAKWDTGVRSPVTGDRMTAFSSRGPLGDWIKPDVTAPGIQILAGTTPDPHDAAIFSGPPGELFQSIAGTSMSSPHAAGVSALVKAAHPDWTPGMIKSALMTSSVQDVLKEDGVTPADPFDRGAGSIRADRAIRPTIVFDTAAADFVALGANPLTAIDVNLASVNAPTMSGEVSTSRTFVNVSSQTQVLRAKSVSPAGAEILVTPKTISVPPGATRTIDITITAVGVPEGQFFGQIMLDARSPRATDAVLPVAFFVQQGVVTLEHVCDPTTIARGEASACQVTAENLAPVDASIDLSVQAGAGLSVENVSSPGEPSGNGFTFSGTLAQSVAPTIDAITPGGSPAGFLPLSLFDIPPNENMGDEGIITFDVPEYLYGSEPYARVSITANGYAIVGDGTTVDFVPQEMPDPALPNNVLAPFWSDLNQEAGGDTRAALLTDGVNSWIVLEWTDFPSFSDHSLTNSFQIWLQVDETEGIFFTYGTIGGSADDSIVGAENRDGSSGVNLGLNVDPASDSDFTIETSGPTPGGSVTITYDAVGERRGSWPTEARLTSNVMQGVTVERVVIQVT
jgi:subtilase family protein/fibronectin type III domain protein